MNNKRLNGCGYCMGAHTTISQIAKVSADEIEALRNDTEIEINELEALRIFTIRINETRGWVVQRDLDSFFTAGYDKVSALDVVVGTSHKVLSTYTNHITHTTVDAVFAKNTWPPAESSVA